MMGSAAILAFALSLSAPGAAAPAPRLDPVLSALGQCAPTTYDAAIECLDRSLPAGDRAALAQPNGPVGVRFFIGMFISNHWGLASGGPLYEAMQAFGFVDPADMSDAILDGLAARDRGQQLDLAAKAAEARRASERALRQAAEDGPPGSIYCAFPAGPPARVSQAAADAAMQACSEALGKASKSGARR